MSIWFFRFIRQALDNTMLRGVSDEHQSTFAYNLKFIPEYGIFNLKDYPMSKNTSVILGEHFDKFIKKEIAKGKYSSASEVLRNGLRKLEEEQEKIKLIKKALVVGEKSGKPISFDNTDFKKRMKSKYAK